MNNKELKANAIVGVAPLGDPHFEEHTPTSPKVYTNSKSKIKTLTSDNKGITLIALVITIIVMLILVAVTVTIALNGGLFSTAKQAKVETENKINEEQNLASGKVEIDGEWYNSIEEYTDGGKGTTPTEDNFGDFVEYGVDLNNDGNNKNDWKVFYVDDDGNTFIIAADYVSSKKCDKLEIATKAANMTESTETGYEDHCYYWSSTNVKEGDNQKVKYYCNDKHNTELNSNKAQCSFPDIFMETGYYCSDHVGTDGSGGNPNSRCASSLMCTENWRPFVDISYGASYAIGGPTLEMWVASWNKKHGKDVDKDDGITLCANGNKNSDSYTGYCIGEGENPTDYYKYITSCTDGYNDELYFPHKTYNDLELDEDNNRSDVCDGYWLATPSAKTSNDLMLVAYDGCVSYGECVDFTLFYKHNFRRSPRNLSNIWSQISKHCRA